ncbi:MAG: sigma-70 family RNA polymerase sigma factor [Ignavibacteriales bacterium]|nr:sigma-70 family RNA polymerase sigma factor [Ignavibacteriaceae bacterium]QOJ28241.1 MAG: sigma-70 family RNA polymerase sigma factor [Ignavibacteriales bacterium]
MAVSYSDLSDADLMQKVAQSDSRALEALYNRYSSILYTLIKKIVGDQALAESVLVDVYVLIWTKIRFYHRESGNAYCWLINLARNKAVDTIRRQKPDQFENYEYTDEYENYFIMPRLSLEIDQLDLATALQIKGNIEEALHKLTDAQQYVIYLAYYEGLTQDEIAAKLKIPVQTVKSKIVIALTNLKDNLLKGGE